MKQILLWGDTKMTGLKKLSVVAATSSAALLMGIATAPAEAALFKLSFTSDEANGYFIFDNSFQPRSSTASPVLGEYYGAATDYKIDLGDKGVFQGSYGTPILYLNRAGNPLSRPDRPDEDQFILFVEKADRQPPQSEYSLSNIFVFPKDSLGSTDHLPTSVPSTATLEVHPYVYFNASNSKDPNNTIGDTIFTGTVQTQLEPVPEPRSLSAIFGVGIWLVLRRRQLRQVLPNAEVITSKLLKRIQNKQTVS